jgi:hypothetical protein
MKVKKTNQRIFKKGLKGGKVASLTFALVFHQ